MRSIDFIRQIRDILLYMCVLFYDTYSGKYKKFRENRSPIIIISNWIGYFLPSKYLIKSYKISQNLTIDYSKI